MNVIYWGVQYKSCQSYQKSLDVWAMLANLRRENQIDKYFGDKGDRCLQEVGVGEGKLQAREELVAWMFFDMLEIWVGESEVAADKAPCKSKP